MVGNPLQIILTAIYAEKTVSCSRLTAFIYMQIPFLWTVFYNILEKSGTVLDSLLFIRFLAL